MKRVIIFLIISINLIAAVVKSPIVIIDNNEQIATIKIAKIDVGMSGFIVHEIAPNHTSILKNVVVKSHDKNTEIAILKMSDYTGLRNNALPTGKWSVKVGDTAVFAFGYSRALLVAPSEEVYHQVTKSINIQWIHPDIFATILSFNGHPTPLKEDFEAMSDASSIGLVFIYLNKKLFMLDIKSFKILTINDVPLVQESVKLPFYTRVEEIDAAWWGEGSERQESYEPYYYELLVEFNKKDKNLYEIIKNGEEKLHYLLDTFEIGN